MSLRLQDLPIAKTSNLQPCLFHVLQEVDAGAELVFTIEVKTGAGIPEDVLEQRIVQDLEQLQILVEVEVG